MPSVTQEFLNFVVQFHSEGKTNRQIAASVGVHHTTIAYHLKNLGLSSNFIGKLPIDIVSEGMARCRKCKEIKSVAQFCHNRRGQKYEYQFGVCNLCRYNRHNDRVNADVKLFLRDRFRRICVRARHRQHPCDLDLDYFIWIYEQQKGLCFYSDISMITQLGKGRSKLHESFSIDKVVPRFGYVKGNVVFCIDQVNWCKNDVSLDRMKLWMPGWYDRLVRCEWITVVK